VASGVAPSRRTSDRLWQHAITSTHGSGNAPPPPPGPGPADAPDDGAPQSTSDRPPLPPALFTCAEDTSAPLNSKFSSVKVPVLSKHTQLTMPAKLTRDVSLT